MIIKLPIIEDNKIILGLFKLYKESNIIYLSQLQNNKKHSLKINLDNNNDIFKLSINESEYSSSNIKLSPINNNLKSSDINLIKILVCNNTNGINYINIFTPLKFYIIDELFVWNIHFMQMCFLSNYTNNNIDFISQLNSNIKKYFNYEILGINKLKLYENNIWKLINNEYYEINKINEINILDEFNINFWNNLNILLNAGIYILYNYSNITQKKIKDYQKKYQINKNIISIYNIIKSYKFSINLSNKYNFVDHLNIINNNNILKLNEIENNKSYFLEINNNKFILIHIESIVNDLIICNNLMEINFNKYKILYYPPNFKITINDLIISLLNNKDILYELIIKYKIVINKLDYDNILNYFINKPILSNFSSIIENSNFEILKTNSYSKDFFKKIVLNNINNKNNTINLFKILFDNYNYPIKFNKQEIDDNFDDILYISLSNISFIFNLDNKIIDKNKLFLRNEINNIIPIKIRMLYFNLMKTFYLMIYHTKDDNLFTIKYFQDNIHKNFIKIFFNNNNETINLLRELIRKNKKNDIEIIFKVKNIIKTNYLLIDVINKLSWSNLSNRLLYLSILMDNNKLLFYKEKFNKIIFPDNFDIRIKNIIINPFEMFKYLRKENDFYKWLKFLGIKCIELYNYPISLSSDDFNNLAKIIYNLINIKEQNLKDESYSRFINYCNKYPKLIIDDNNRINLKIKEYLSYSNSSLNLGILAKHICSKNSNIIEFNLDETDIEIIKLKNKLENITKKYIKYKKKYIAIKNNQIEYLSSNQISNTS